MLCSILLGYVALQLNLGKSWSCACLAGGMIGATRINHRFALGKGTGLYMR